MKKKNISILLAAVLGVGAMGYQCKADDATTQPSTQPSAQLVKSSNDRADSIVRNLNIDDHAKAGRVHDAIVDFMVNMHQWHQANDAQIKELSKNKDANAAQLDSIQATRHSLHDASMAKLSADLTPDQMDVVKEKLTGGQMTATLKNYPVIVPNLTDEDMAMVKKTLLEGREEAMDAGTKTERIAIFKKYKGKINNYLNAHGHNVSQSYKDFGAAQKAKKAGQPATEPADPN